MKRFFGVSINLLSIPVCIIGVFTVVVVIGFPIIEFARAMVRYGDKLIAEG